MSGVGRERMRESEGGKEGEREGEYVMERREKERGREEVRMKETNQPATLRVFNLNSVPW